MNSGDDEKVVPIVREDLHVDAVPVETGTVRVIKRRHVHDEIVERELRKGRAEIRHVKLDRVVDGPQPVRREGNMTVIPIVSEVLKIEKQFVLTEEIHITQIEESDIFRQSVPVQTEEARIERIDDKGQVLPVSNHAEIPGKFPKDRPKPHSLLKRLTRKPAS